ncbi:MAG: hypothetical protein K9M10_02330 [Candidatus Pacebacteria bacterium]|nr:hypothetical protein [Candidatus Paceibacterota bacterium]MCF7857292.1 hypothetical protein [Candidatus Paceibacterota bacterium]
MRIRAPLFDIKENEMKLNFGWFKVLKEKIKQTFNDDASVVEIQSTSDDDKDFAQHVAEPKERPGQFYGYTAIWCILMALLFGIALWTMGNKIDTADPESITTGQVILAIMVLWIVASIKKLQADELGAVLLYGLPMIKVRRGPKFLVFGVFQLERFNGTVEHNQFPDEPEFIQKTDDATPLEIVEITTSEGVFIRRQKVRPIRITTAKPRKSSPDDILNVQMTVEVTFWVRWIVVDPFKFIVSAGGDVKRVTEQMRDVGESYLNNEVTKLTPSRLISAFDKLQKDLETEIINGVEPWGVMVIKVGMTAPDFNHEVASELRNIPKENAKAVQVRTKADAEAYRLEAEGVARGKARAAELAGEGRGYKEAAVFIGVEPKEMLAAQVARDTVGEGDLILGTDGITEALGLGMSVLKKKRSAS